MGSYRKHSYKRFIIGCDYYFFMNRLKKIESVRAKLYKEYGYETPEQVIKFIGKDQYRRVSEGKMVTSKKDLLKDDDDLRLMIRARMKQMKITQSDLSYMSKCSRSVISGYLGATHPEKMSQQKLMLVLQILGIQVKLTFSLLDF